ncbi:MAG: GIY-YIG nuclease family protein [Candidatus Staskawiczbacteria bacterium]|nr:GIY-YIG nuclease family protein [Candidatus Staskawiczbacteria bacterium]MBI3337074.1 GIY-YIG nuclease family protein [Candidatus Staskawiczbacteria bacterium]
MFYVYVLQSKKDKRHYIGFTKDLKNRFKEHVLGNVRATFYRRPLELIYYESYKDRKIAQKRERQLKGGNAHVALINRLRGG